MNMYANLKRSVIIEDENRYCYHLQVESRAINPRDPTHPIVNRRILCLRVIDYKKYFGGPVEEQIGYLKAMGLENVELVHDPTLEEVVRIETKPSAEERAIIEKRTKIVSPLVKARRAK